MLLRLADKLGEELERGRGSDISRILASEFHELVIEGGHYHIREASHDVVDQVWSEGNVKRSSSSWNCWMISRLASRVLILGANSSAAS